MLQGTPHNVMLGTIKYLNLIRMKITIGLINPSSTGMVHSNWNEMTPMNKFEQFSTIFKLKYWAMHMLAHVRTQFLVSC